MAKMKGATVVNTRDAKAAISVSLPVRLMSLL